VAAPYSRTSVDPEPRSRTGAGSLMRKASRPGTKASKARVEQATGVKAHNPQARNGSKVATLKKGSKVATRKSDNKVATLNQRVNGREAKDGVTAVRPLVKASETKIAVLSRIEIPSSSVLTRLVGRKMSTGRRGKVLETATISETSNKANDATTSNGMTNSSKAGNGMINSSKVNGRTRVAGE